ncbi:MAG: hypothetical protein O3B95_02515 [Chloroflexi bacterium]|nr:hypothetical protein [Chloroflexota bacterium]
MAWMQSASSRWLIAIASSAAVLIIVSVLISVLADNRNVDILPVGTPEGTVQRYLQALTDGDLTAAYGYVSTDLKNECTLEHFLETARWREKNFSASVRDTTIIDDRTIVTVEITEPGSNQPFSQGGYSFDTIFTLTSDNEEWRISEPPWPVSWCPPKQVTHRATAQASAKVGPDLVPAPWSGFYGEGGWRTWSS